MTEPKAIPVPAIFGSSSILLGIIIFSCAAKRRRERANTTMKAKAMT
jgi:hypothetical protein